MKRVVVIDRAVEVGDLLRKVLTRAGHQVWTATEARAGLELVSTHRPHVLIVDKHPPDMHVVEVVSFARAKVPTVQVVLMTAQSEPFALSAHRPDGYLAKPFKSIRHIEEAVDSMEKIPTKSLTQALTEAVAELAPRPKRRR